jgi:hypothetical protein
MKVNPHIKFGPSEFRDYAKSHPALFFPAFAMQSLLQTKVLGKAFWKSHAEKRVSRHGPTLRLKDVLAIHTKPNDMTEKMLNDSLLPALSNMLQLTNTRVHRAQNRKERERERRKRAHDEILEKRARKRQDMLDEIVNKCTTPDINLTPNNDSSHGNMHPPMRKLSYWKSENHLNGAGVGRKSQPRKESELLDEGQEGLSQEEQSRRADAARQKAEEKWEVARQKERGGSGQPRKRRVTLSGMLGWSRVAPATAASDQVAEEEEDVPLQLSMHPVLGPIRTKPATGNAKQRRGSV